MFPILELKAFLESEGFTEGNLYERLKTFLEISGDDSQIAEALYDYLYTLGYEGTLNDRIKAWRNDSYATALLSVFVADVYEAGVFN
jgi:hypothetical protein